MPWFPVDDGFHSHPKTLATSLAARGLWATAGSWCSDPAHHSDGVVPAHVLESLGGTPELAAELVAAGFWRRTRKGYAFHDWFDWGSKRTAKEQATLSAVRAENGRRGGLVSASKRARNTKQNGSKPGFASRTGAHTSGHDPPPDQGEGPSKPEANPKQLASPGLGKQTNPNTSTNKEPPNPPPSGGHDGSHPNCRACGTNPRGPTPAPKPTPTPPAFDEVHHVNGNPLRGDANAQAAAQARAAITRDAPDA